jgi:hypothetical protein
MKLLSIRRHSITFRGLSLAVASSLPAVLLASCGHSIDPDSISSIPTRANLERVDNSLDKLTAQHQQAPSGSGDLAKQSQRDVDYLLQNRAANGSSGTSLSGVPQGLPQAPALGSHVATGETATPRKTVVWNDPKTGKPAAESSAAPVAPTNPPNQPTTALGSDATTNLANTPSSQPAVAASRPSLEPDRLRQLMVDLSRELYATGAYSEAPLRQLMMIAAMSMIDPDRKLEPQAIPDLTEKERDLLGKLQAFFAELGKSLDGSPDADKAIIEAVAKLRESIVKEPQLKLATIALCTRVGGFGDFSEFDKRAFLALAEQKAIVYLEIEDFTSQLNSKSEYVTEISQQLTIYNDRDGIPVWRGDWQAAVDVTKNKRQDFFTVQVITLPKALSVGKYHMKVRVRDEKSGAEAENSLDFEMVADPKMAAMVK